MAAAALPPSSHPHHNPHPLAFAVGPFAHDAALPYAHAHAHAPAPFHSGSLPPRRRNTPTSHHRRHGSVFLPNSSSSSRRRLLNSHCRSFSTSQSDDYFRHGLSRSLVASPPPANTAGSGLPVDNKQHQNTARTSATATPRLLESPQLYNSSSLNYTPIAGRVPRVHSLDMAVARNRTTPSQMHVPDSPPELSSSKSSKSSSSFRSSILSDSIGPDSVTHFEDISLNDAKRDSYDLHAHGKDGRARVQVRPMHSVMVARRKQLPAVDTMRSVHMAQKLPYSLNKPTGVLDEKSTNLPISRTQRHGPRAGSGSFAPSSPTTVNSTSRSPSPSKGMMKNAALVRSSASAPTGFLDVGPPRRKTCAPSQRKTVKQLEDEYHDSDEDVPDDAVIWNVPLSPLEPFAAISRDPSPRRKSSHSSLSSNGKMNALDKVVSEPTTTMQESNPQSPRHFLTLPRSATTGSFPDHVGDHLSLHERHQSWANDLCEDARELSAAFEAHSNHSNRASIDSRRSGANPPSPTRVLQRSQTSFVSLPPIQKSNNMIDPLPISKEKEAVLTRTRPSWLPPKSKKEERRHIKEWEQMMAHSAVADRRRAAKRLEEIEAARQSQHSIERIWEDHVLPNWNQAITEPRTRELWWRGVNSKNRGEVWKKAIGNELQISAASYTAALTRSASVLDSSVVDQIKTDAATPFPETGLFTDGAPLNASLIDLLMAHSAYRPDVGYVHGMHCIAALLLLNMSAEDAFASLANLLNRPLPLAFFTNDKTATEKWIGMVMSLMKIKLPALHDHLLSEKMSLPSNADEESSVAYSPAVDSVAGSRPSSRDGPATLMTKSRSSEFIAPMLSTLLTTHLDLDTLSRIWDIYVFESDQFLVRAFVGLCGNVENKLYGSKAEVLAVLGQEGSGCDIWHQLGEIDHVIEAIREAGRSGSQFMVTPKKA